MDLSQHVWLAADYHFPSTYSCRVPMSSMNSASVTPAPGPATVRLALIRVGIELFGMEYVRDTLFPVIRAMNVCIRPPEHVALSYQVVRAYKADEDRTSTYVSESPVYREMAHAEGVMTVYLEIPRHDLERWSVLLMAIGYWGQASSFASCTGITQTAPNVYECATPIQALATHAPLQPYFSCVLSEFRDYKVEWHDVIPHARSPQNNPFTLDIYVWPLLIAKQHSGGKLLVRSPLVLPTRVE